MVFIFILMVLVMKEDGIMIYKMVMELKYGLMVLNMKVIIIMELNMVRVNLYGEIKHHIVDNLSIIILMELEDIYGLMVGSSVENG